MNDFFKKNRLVLLHLLFWGLYFSFFFYQITYRKGGEPNYTRAFLDAFMQVGTMAAISYLNYFYFLPRFLKKKNWFLYLLEFSVPFIVIVFIQVWLKQEIYQDGNARTIRWLNSSRFVIQHLFSAFFIVTFVAMLRFFKDWFELENKRKEVENEKLVAELKFLKEQINPHFLFNTLNNLYYLAQSKSEKTPVVISELSQMMRYMIYDSNQETVMVSKEIDYIENYLSLEKLRLDENIKIEFNVTGSAETLRVVPFVFITFLENAFKHGLTSNDPEAFIEVSLKFIGNKCQYIVRNSIPDSDKTNAKKGIGLNNVKRRLDLLYTNKYDLKISEVDHIYEVKLDIEL